MDVATLEKISQWEQTFAKGNKKPITVREYPPLRPKKDIVIHDVKSLPLPKKNSIKKLSETLPPTAKLAEKNATPSVTPEASTKGSKPSEGGKSRKEYYESWDKFNVDEALDGIDKSEVGDSKPPQATPLKQTKKVEASIKSKAQVVDTVAANTQKEKGNVFFKKGQYQKAIEHYTSSMNLDPSNSVLPINRAMALLKIGKFAEAEQDCTLGLRLDSKNVKALWRRGIARRSLGKTNEAKTDFESALKIDPANKAVKEELAKLQLAQPEKPRAAIPTTTTKQPVVQPAKQPVAQPAKQPVAQTTKKPATAVSTDISSTDIAIKTISSKRVLIKEVEGDQDSELFTPPPVKKPVISSVPDKQEQAVTSTISETTAKSTLNSDSSKSFEQAKQSTSASPPVSSTLSKVPSDSPSPSTATAPAKAPSSDVKMTSPKTTLDFQRDWKSYSKKPELLYHYIKVITPESFPALFQSSFESDYLTSMLTAFREFFIPFEEPQLLYRYLLNLVKVQRFDMTLMFMSGTDKKDLISIFQHLSRSLGHQEDYSQQDLTTLASKFKISSYQ
ncbi:RNA polymerase II-associated protein 3 [Entomortierella beljakovae]|nr:RNA polymerase II-associated protein 3 [Entomortierella beljakovae]